MASGLTREEQAHVTGRVVEAEPALGHRRAVDSWQPGGRQPNRRAADVSVEGRDTHGMIIRRCASSPGTTSCGRRAISVRSR